MDPSQLMKGLLDVAVLAVVSVEDNYGYEVIRRLRDSGLADIGDASVYGTLRRLYQADALNSYPVASDEGPHRKYYAINETGRKLLEEGCQTWRSFAETIDNLLTLNRSTS